jgi:hypothetical protein
MKHLLLSFALLLASLALHAQYGGPRLFLDIPVIGFTAPDVTKISNSVGASLETAMNVASHWGTVRVGGGALFTVSPDADDVAKSFNTTPFVLMEAGAGLYRSNGNRCAKTKQNAFTAIAKVGLRYEFRDRILEQEPQQLDYTIGGEFGFFFIRDVFKNYEVFLSPNYHFNAEALSATFGFKMFLNLRADRD